MTTKKAAKKLSAFESIRHGLIEARDLARGKKIGARVHEVRIETPPVSPRSPRRK